MDFTLDDVPDDIDQLKTKKRAPEITAGPVFEFKTLSDCDMRDLSDDHFICGQPSADEIYIHVRKKEMFIRGYIMR